MKVALPVLRDDNLPDWGRKLLVALDQAFAQIRPELDTGVIAYWSEALPALPVGWLAADGATYPSRTFPRLAKLLGESDPGEFTVPDFEAPEGFIAIVKT